MAKEDGQSSQLNLTVVALVALVAIVGLVALVLNTAGLAQISTGGTPVYAVDDSVLADEGNVAGQASRGPINTVSFTYQGFNPDNRVLLFVKTASGTPYYVALSGSGSGALVHGGSSYGVQATLSVNASNSTMAGLVRIDADADGTLETKLRPGGSFQIYTGPVTE